MYFTYLFFHSTAYIFISFIFMHFMRITQRLFDAVLDYSERITSHLTSRNLEKQLNTSFQIYYLTIRKLYI